MKYALAELNAFDKQLHKAERVLVATDFDGTLCPIVDHPANARLAPATRELLQRMTKSQKIDVAVLSGRAIDDVMTRSSIDAVFGGNHGLELSGPGLHFRHPEAERMRPALAQLCVELAEATRDYPGCWVENKGLSATLHYRAVHCTLQRKLLIRARGTVASAGRAFALRAGKCALEIRPRIEWDKGSAVQYLLGRSPATALCICLGDDRTDEAMFRANTSGINVKVGNGGGSTATYYLTDPCEVPVFLAHVQDACASYMPDLQSASVA